MQDISRVVTDTLFRAGIFVILLYLCAKVIAPFLPLMLWALILAIALYPVHQKLAGRLGGKQGRASIVMVLVGVLLLGGPMVFLAVSAAGDSQNAHSIVSSGPIEIPAPADSVKDWPVIGEKTYAAWNMAATNFSEFQEIYGERIKQVSEKAVAAATSVIGGVFLFLGALIIAGVMMAFGAGASSSMQKIFCRFAGSEKGVELHALSVATVRSVAVGVIGVAFIQSLLFALGFVLAGIPFAGLLALAVLLTGIVQLPALLFGLPAIAYLWMGADLGTLPTILLTVYFFIASLSDNVLKPLLLGRGVDAPLAVVLIGALGGMFVAGFIGLFIGAVLLSVGYKIFMSWVDEGTKAEGDDSAAGEGEASA